MRHKGLDPEGRFIRSLERKGQGPGEFERPRRLFIDLKDRIVIADPNRFQVIIFDPRDIFDKSLRVEGYPNEGASAGDGTMFIEVDLIEIAKPFIICLIWLN